jgi:AcrR family transcriptional regulator
MGGRPRSTACDRAILDAVLAEYSYRGLEAMSVDAVAARAGVSKATIYRRYPSKIDLVMAAATMLCEETAITLDSGSLAAELHAFLHHLARRIADPVLGAAKRTLLFDAARHAEFAELHRTLVSTRRDAVKAMLRRGVERGEMRDDVDLEFATDQLSAPLFYRNLLLGADLDDAYVDAVIADFLERYGVPAALATGGRTG